jgi:transcriptional regulator with XRE-family HTH domain
MVEGVKAWIARQVRTLREQRDWSQDDLGRATGKPQSAISRVEDPDYGKLTLQTLFDLAKAYDVPLLVQFVEWGDWLARMNDASTESLQKESFNAAALTDVGVSQLSVDLGQATYIDPFEQSRIGGLVYPSANVHRSRGMSMLAAGTINLPATVTYGRTNYASPIFYDEQDRDFEFEQPFPLPSNVLEVEGAENG